MVVKSAADVFRVRQAAADLRFLGQAAKPSLLARVADVSPELSAETLMLHVAARGPTFVLPRDEVMMSTLILCAAMPDDDFPAFLFATCLLIADRLHFGAGRDDLYWNWDAFSNHYRLADDVRRAAIMGGYRALAIERGLDLSDPPTERDCLTEPEIALADPPDPDEAGRQWSRVVRQPGALTAEQKSHFRYLVEREAGIAPPDPETCPVVPPLKAGL